MRVLAIDYGERRLGLAVSDEAGAFAFPAGVLERRGGRRDFAALRALAQERGVEAIVVGLPLHLDAREGPEAAAARAFAAALGDATGLPVETLDERWTTREAERSLREQGLVGRRGRERKRVVDEVAATLLLRAWLARRAAQPAGGRCGAGAE
ncbi:MAG TPA: Holliday junction resolvase RuvX [Myxococcota bacterium]|nr:Holliday junction resolvase RuvX [Myxococcota bacterium]